MNIILTGGARGLGFELAQLILDEGIHHLCIIDRSESPWPTEAYKENLRFIQTDIRVLTNDHLTRELNDWDSIDILINNAGVVHSQSFVDITDVDWTRLFDVNFMAAIKMIRWCVPLMSYQTSQSHILNIGSMGGYQGSIKFKGLCAYSASKAALANLTESLAVEFAELKISVNCLCPGSIDTEMFQEAFPEYRTDMSPSEMATFVWQFAKTGNRFFNGKVLPVATMTP